MNLLFKINLLVKNGNFIAMREICSKFNNVLNPLSANPTKRPNTLKQFVGKLPTNCLSVFNHFVQLALKGLTSFRCLYCKLWKDCTYCFDVEFEQVNAGWELNAVSFVWYQLRMRFFTKLDLDRMYLFYNYSCNNFGRNNIC